MTREQAQNFVSKGNRAARAGSLEPPALFEAFSLLGGPLHRLGCRLGLVRARATFGLGLVLGSFLWTVLIVLAYSEGLTDKVFSLTTIGAHARLLVAIPLLFLSESWVDPKLAAFIRLLVRAQVVPPAAWPALESAVQRCTRWKDATLPEILCLAAAVLLTWLGPHVIFTGASAVLPSHAIADMTLTGQWYWLVCLTLFRLLLFRWLWRLGLWCLLLWRVARLELHLVPTHPDGAAGLGYLEVVQMHFTPLIITISVIQSAGLAEEIVAGSMPFSAIYGVLALVLCVDVVLFVGPLFLFVPILFACRNRGLSEYTELAARYVNGFEKKWLSAGDSAEHMLGNADFQSLADLANSVNLVRNMRTLPTSRKTMIECGIAAALPFTPLLLLQYPITALVEKFFQRLSGL